MSLNKDENKDDIGSLEKARKRLYDPMAPLQDSQPSFTEQNEHTLPHMWKDDIPPLIPRGKRHVRFANIFLGIAFVFFLLSLGVAGFLFYFGSNSVSIDKITIDLQGPTTIAGGDMVPLSLIITNKNPVAIDNAIIEINFPTGTRNASNTLEAYPRYIENFGTLPSGATIT